MRRQVRADKNQIGVHAVHQVEFSFCPFESSLPIGFRQPLKITKRLEQHYFQPIILDQPPNIHSRAVIGQKILLEDFDAGEAGALDRCDFLAEVTSDRYRGNAGSEFT